MAHVARVTFCKTDITAATLTLIATTASTSAETRGGGFTNSTDFALPTTFDEYNNATNNYSLNPTDSGIHVTQNESPFANYYIPWHRVYRFDVDIVV